MHLTALISLVGMVLGFRLGRYVRNIEEKLKMSDMSHTCKPHHCNKRGVSCVCLERPNGEFWVKEYGDGKQKEGRTYQVNFCPWCGVKAEIKYYGD
jgi:hypothetical protein